MRRWFEVANFMVIERLRPRQSIEAWRVGAEGERATGRVLDQLPDGYVALHDLRMPGGRGNIDHVVVGPTGVFTVETKNCKHCVVIKGGKARSSSRALDKVVDQVQRQSTALAAKTGTPVTPIVCVHGKGATVEGWFQNPTVDGVRFCSGSKLRKVLTDRDPTFSSDDVTQISSLLDVG